MAIFVDDIQHKRDTEANWDLNNPVLKSGELGFVLEPDVVTPSILVATKHKVGDGRNWADIPFYSSSGSGGGTTASVNRVQNTGTTVDFIVSSQPAQSQYRDLNTEGASVVITDVTGIPLNQSIVLDINGVGNAFTYTFSVAGSKIYELGSYKAGVRNIITIVSLNDATGSESYVINYSVPKNDGYNLELASLGDAQDPTIVNKVMNPARVFDTLNTKKTLTVLVDGATVTWDYGFNTADDGDKVQVTLGGNRTLAISGMDDGDSGVMVIIQDGTGSRTLALPANSFCSNGNTTLQLSSGANTRDHVHVERFGANYYFSPANNYVAAT